MKKMSKIAKVIDKSLGIIQILFKVIFVAGIVAAIIGIVAMFVESEMLYDITGPVSFGFIDLKLSEDALLNETAVKIYAMCIIALLPIVGFVGCWAIQIFRNMLKAIIEEQPFNSALSIGLKKLSWIVLIAGTVLLAFEAGESFMITQAYNLKEIFSSQLIQEYIVNYNFDLSFILEFAVLYMLSYVFKYGEELQQQADETL